MAGSSELLSKGRNADSHENPCVNKVSRSTIYRGGTPGPLLVKLRLALESLKIPPCLDSDRMDAGESLALGLVEISRGILICLGKLVFI